MLFCGKKKVQRDWRYRYKGLENRKSKRENQWDRGMKNVKDDTKTFCIKQNKHVFLFFLPSVSHLLSVRVICFWNFYQRSS